MRARLHQPQWKECEKQWDCVEAHFLFSRSSCPITVIYTVLAMKRFTFVIFGSLFCLGWTFSHAEAAFVINEGCEDVGVMEEALDSHTEARFSRYIQRSGEPRTFTSEEQYQRWCTLWNDNESIKSTRRSTRADLRTRSLDQRFYKVRQERADVDFTTDLELEDLSPSRQGRILQRVKSENCDPGSQSEDDLIEYAICKRLMDEKDTARDTIITNRRLEIRGLRSSARIQSAVEQRRQIRMSGYSSGAVSLEVQSIEKQERSEYEFDPEGPGSIQLSESLENRIRFFAEREHCIRLVHGEQKVRCEWLVKFNRNQRKGEQEKAQRRLQRAGISEDFRVRRGVDQTYRSSIGTTSNVIKSRRLQGGFRPTPRTIQEAQEMFQAPVTVEGDED